MKDIFLGFWKAPAATLQQAMTTADKVPQYLLAAAFAIIMLIAVCVMGKNDLIGSDKIFMFALGMTAAALGLRIVYAIGVFLMAKKNNQGLTLQAVLGMFSITFSLDAVIVLLIMVSMLITLYELTLALLLFWLLATVITSLLVTWIVTLRQMEATYKITLILQLILMIVLIFVIRSIAAKMITSMAGSMMRGFY